MRLFLLAAAMLTITGLQAQNKTWQQRVEYKIDVRLDSDKHQFSGKEVLTYYNNSGDALNKVYYHLYFNAFQPGSAMDVRSRTIEDPDPRVSDRIFNLKPEECGWLHAKSLRMDGKTLSFTENETILEVTLDKPIPAGGKAVFEMEFEGQVPLQIRRSGRDNAEGIDYSMSQWYPKMCEYDSHGWHPNPYIGREFYGVWGNFDVNITLDSSYTIGATGLLQNPLEIGKGYADDESKVKRPAGKELTWKFRAENVHDFVWAADPDYAHDKLQVADGPTLHFFYQKNTEYAQAWKDLQPLAAKAFNFMSKNFGVYPYPQYSVIQGGDGGMEYPMATLITGNRKLPSLTGVTVHEAAHSWYQGVLATDEARFAWMDEGFTSFATTETMDYLFKGGMPSTHAGAYSGYFDIVNDGKEEALDTHADHFMTNYAYGTAAYNKGEVYLAQLEYVLGPFHFRSGLLNYFNTWKFRHPDNYDFIHILEMQSGMELDWYNEYFVNTTKTIDYSISAVRGENKKTFVSLLRKGEMPMPVDVEVIYADGSRETFVIALDLQRGEKNADGYNGKWTMLADWRWVDPVYTFEISRDISEVKSIEIDASGFLADIDRKNNRLELDNTAKFILENR